MSTVLPLALTEPRAQAEEDGFQRQNEDEQGRLITYQSDLWNPFRPPRNTVAIAQVLNCVAVAGGVAVGNSNSESGFSEDMRGGRR